MNLVDRLPCVCDPAALREGLRAAVRVHGGKAVAAMIGTKREVVSRWANGRQYPVRAYRIVIALVLRDLGVTTVTRRVETSAV